MPLWESNSWNTNCQTGTIYIMQHELCRLHWYSVTRTFYVNFILWKHPIWILNFQYLVKLRVFEQKAYQKEHNRLFSVWHVEIVRQAGIWRNHLAEDQLGVIIRINDFRSLFSILSLRIANEKQTIFQTKLWR